MKLGSNISAVITGGAQGIGSANDNLARALAARGVHHLAGGVGHLADRVADGRGLELARVRDGQAQDGAGVKRTVGGGRGSAGEKGMAGSEGRADRAGARCGQPRYRKSPGRR